MPANATTSTDLLAGLSIVECASFVAGPSGCMTLAMLGADVVRVDPIGGAADHNRWPVSTATGASLYWTALNRGKRSVAVDLRSDEGRELVTALATRPGPDAGLLVDNNVGRPWLGYEALSAVRPDLIQVHIQGHADGRPAVDYTVNAEVGIPDITGPTGTAGPVNHVLPAWDLLAGMTAVTGLVSALRRRDRTGEGTFMAVALADIALSGVASMGWLAEVAEQGDRARMGNHLYGSFGVDFATSDAERVMVVALTERQWHNLVAVTETGAVFAALETALDVDLSEESGRFAVRETIESVLRPWFAARTLATVTAELDRGKVLWSRYRSMAQTVAELSASPSPTILTSLDQPGVGTVPSTRSPIRVGGDYTDPRPAPRLGEHTDEVLGTLLGLSPAQIGVLHDRGVVASAS